MDNIWLVAQHELMKNIRKKSFLFAMFGMPAVMGILFGIIFLAETLAEDTGIDVRAVGYVDEAQVLVDTVNPPEMWQEFSDVDAARQALEEQSIQVYFVLPESYLQTGTVSIFAYGKTAEAVQDEIAAFLVENLIVPVGSDAPVERLFEPANYTLFLENNQRELTQESVLGLLTVPMLFAVALLIALQISAGFLMAGVAEEKGNHIMEILMSSIRPSELLAGKLIGLGILGLLQIGMWVVVVLALLPFAANNDYLSAVTLPMDAVLLALLYFILTYFMYASVLAGVGAILGSEQEGRQYAGLLLFPLALPFMFFSLFLTNPESSILVFMTLFPLTSAMTVMLRMPFAAIPLWQIGLSLVLLFVTTILIIWVSAKVFRWALLLYGKKITPRTVWQVVRGDVDPGMVPVHGKEASR